MKESLETPEKKTESKPKQNKSLGTKYYIAFTFSYSLTFVTSKILYDRNPDLSADVFLFLRSVWATIIVFAILNVNSAKILVYEMDRQNIRPLIFRSVQGSVGSMINFLCTK